MKNLELERMGLVELPTNEHLEIAGGLTAFDVIRWLWNHGQAADSFWLASITPVDYVIC